MKRVKWRAPDDEDLDVRGWDSKKERRRGRKWTSHTDEDLDDGVMDDGVMDGGLEFDDWDDWSDEVERERQPPDRRRSG